MTEWHPLRSQGDVASESWQSLNSIAEKRAKEAPSAPMPSLEHASLRDYDHVYEPSDDTYLLIDGIQADITENQSIKENCNLALEIGCGSGVPIVHLAKSTDSTLAIATDVNQRALAFTRQTAAENGVKRLEALQCDLASTLLPRFKQMVDVIIFNPPYVPTPDDEVSGGGIEASWAGGERGRRVVDRAIPQISQLLAHPHGVCYMITVDDNEPEEIASQFQGLGLTMVPFVRRRAQNEFLTVQKITHTPTPST